MNGELLHRAELPIEMTNGNDGRGSKWFSSAKVRDVIERQLRILGHIRKPFNCPVAVRVTRVLGKRQQLWDFSSCGRGNWKEIEDALVVLGWFHDDGPKYIVDVQWRQRVPKARSSPQIVVEVFKATHEQIAETLPF